jgi:hypothetical protein
MPFTPQEHGSFEEVVLEQLTLKNYERTNFFHPFHF